MTLVKARDERLGSKFYMNLRLLLFKKTLRPYVHKRRFKAQFRHTVHDRNLRRTISSTLKRADFWQTLKHMT